MTADLPVGLVDFVEALTVEPEVFAATGFAGAGRFATTLVSPLETAAPFDFADTAVFAGFAGAGTFLGATTFFPTSCRGLADFSPTLAAGLDDCLEAAVVFAETTPDGDTFGADAFTAGFTLDATLPACDDGRDLEMSLGVGFTGVFPAGWRLLWLAGEFLIESLCLSILRGARRSRPREDGA